jgi:hypothetical protein
MDFVYRVLNSFDGDFDHADRGDLLWRCAGGAVTFSVNCGDLFWWGTADCEPITPENVGVLEQAIRDACVVDRYAGPTQAGSLFCARVRGMRPQGACYKSIPEAFWPLFDACGPAREADLGNPSKQPCEAAT